jgi:hypothetical protein
MGDTRPVGRILTELIRDPAREIGSGLSPQLIYFRLLRADFTQYMLETRPRAAWD